MYQPFAFFGFTRFLFPPFDSLGERALESPNPLSAAGNGLHLGLAGDFFGEQGLLVSKLAFRCGSLLLGAAPARPAIAIIIGAAVIVAIIFGGWWWGKTSGRSKR